MRAMVRRFRRDRRAVAALEMALLSPLAFLLFMGTLELTQLIRVETKLVRATQTIQDIVAGNEDATSTTLAVDFNAGQVIMLPFTTSKLTAAIASVSFNSSAKATSVDWQQLENGSSGMSVATACADAASMSLGDDSVIVVQTSYVYTPIFYYLLGRTFTLTQTAYGRPRDTTAVSDSTSSNGLTGDC